MIAPNPNTGYAFSNGKPFLAQVAIEQTQTPVHKNGKWKDCHGDRVKIRIPAMHPMASTDDAYQLTDDQLPWAIVAKPTTHGNYNHQSCGLHGGEWVLGYFMDEECQIPVITSVLGQNYAGEIKKPLNGTTLGKPVSRFTKGNPPGAHQQGGDKSIANVHTQDELKEDFDKAKQPEEGQLNPAEGEPDLFNPDAPDPEPVGDQLNPAEGEPDLFNPDASDPEPFTLSPVASELPQSTPPPPTYDELPVGAKTDDGATITSGIKQRYPGGPRYQTVVSGLGDGAPQTRWIDNPRDPKFDKARSDAGKQPRSKGSQPGGMLW